MVNGYNIQSIWLPVLLLQNVDLNENLSSRNDISNDTIRVNQRLDI